MKKKLIVCSLIFFVGFLYANEKSVWVTKYEGIDFNNYFCLTRFEGNYEGKFKPFVTHAIFYEDFEVRL